MQANVLDQHGWRQWALEVWVFPPKQDGQEMRPPKETHQRKGIMTQPPTRGWGDQQVGDMGGSMV